MKNLKIFMFGILMVSLHLTSCKKDAELQSKQDAPAENKEKLVETSLTVYNANKTTSTTLRFRAASQEQLDHAGLENLEFTLVKTPEAAAEARDLPASAIAGDEGSSGYSNTNANLANSADEKQVSLEDGIQVDLPLLAKTENVSIEVKSKDLNNGSISSATEQAAVTLYYKFWYKSGYHRIKVTNLHKNPIYPYYYYYYNYWHYTGYHYKLYKYGWAWYRNCYRTTGAKVYYPYYHYYRVDFYKYCS
jgi:hypothetical protein